MKVQKKRGKPGFENSPFFPKKKEVFNVSEETKQDIHITCAFYEKVSQASYFASFRSFGKTILLDNFQNLSKNLPVFTLCIQVTSWTPDNGSINFDLFVQINGGKKIILFYKIICREN